MPASSVYPEVNSTLSRGASSRSLLASSRPPISVGHGQVHLEGRALTDCGGGADVAAALLHDPVHRRQAESGALAQLLGVVFPFSLEIGSTRIGLSHVAAVRTSAHREHEQASTPRLARAVLAGRAACRPGSAPLARRWSAPCPSRGRGPLW